MLTAPHSFHMLQKIYSLCMLLTQRLQFPLHRKNFSCIIGPGGFNIYLSSLLASIESWMTI